MKYIINLLIIVSLIDLCSTAFALNETNAQNSTLTENSTGESSNVLLDDMKITYENKTILITLFIENRNEEYITLNPNIAFKKQHYGSTIRLEEVYEYILVPKKTTHLILKFDSNVFSDGTYNMFLDLKSDETLICEKEYLLTVNGTNFTLSDKIQNDEYDSFKMPEINMNSFFLKAGLFLDNYGIYLIAVLFILIFFERNKKMIPGAYANSKLPKPIKRIKMSAFAAKSNAKKTSTPMQNKPAFVLKRARAELHELDELKLKGWIDEKKYILLRKNILSVTDIAASEDTGEAKKEEEKI